MEYYCGLTMLRNNSLNGESRNQEEKEGIKKKKVGREKAPPFLQKVPLVPIFAKKKKNNLKN